MIDGSSELSVARQTGLLGIGRRSEHHCTRPVSDADLQLMAQIDRLHHELPYAGSGMLQWLLKKGSLEDGRLHVSSHMKRMGIEALDNRPNTSKPTPGHKASPYLLRGLVIDRPNQVWTTDITYIPMARGFIYMTTVIDGLTRRVLSRRVSITLEAAFCIEAVEEALARFGKPKIFKTDQGSQFISLELTKLLADAGVRISMDGKGTWRDNEVVERFWRTIKYVEVYLRACRNVPDARAAIGRYIQFFNTGRSPSSLDVRTPDEAHFNRLPSKKMAA